MYRGSASATSCASRPARPRRRARGGPRGYTILHYSLTHQRFRRVHAFLCLHYTLQHFTIMHDPILHYTILVSISISLLVPNYTYKYTYCKCTITITILHQARLAAARAEPPDGVADAGRPAGDDNVLSF